MQMRDITVSWRKNKRQSDSSGGHTRRLSAFFDRSGGQIASFAYVTPPPRRSLTADNTRSTPKVNTAKRYHGRYAVSGFIKTTFASYLTRFGSAKVNCIKEYNFTVCLTETRMSVHRDFM